MRRPARRTVRRLLRKMTPPVVYVLILAAGLVGFISALHSCSQYDGNAEPGGVRIDLGGR